MGLNLDVDHVAFASDKKFDGFRFRKLINAELAQIAGPRRPPHARRHLRLHGALPALRRRNRRGAGESRLRSGAHPAMAQPGSRFLVARPPARVPRRAAAGARPRARADRARTWRPSRSWRGKTTSGPWPARKSAVERLWQICQVPDYRKVSPQTHADLVGQLYRFLMKDGAVPADWFSRHHQRHGPDRRGHRHPLEPHRAGPDLVLRRQSSRLVEGSGALAGCCASGRGQAIGRAP